MTSEYSGLEGDIETYIAHIESAAKADRRRWKNAPVVQQAVVDNSDIQSRKDAVLGHLRDKINWLKGQFGDYDVMGTVAEPARDTTPAVPLPEYARGQETGTAEIHPEAGTDEVIYYDLRGIRITNPGPGQILITRNQKVMK